MVKLAGAREPVPFTVLVDELGLTRGNLSTHVQRLEGEGLVEVSKSFVERKPLTTYRCTDRGRGAIEAHLRAIEEMIKHVAS
jgi:DNA-binding MarR family transcriptional regulator